MLFTKSKRAFDDTSRIMTKHNKLWLAIGVVGLGALLGLVLTSPFWDTAVSVVGILVYLMVIIASPLSGLLLWVSTNPLADLYINISLGESIPDLSPARFCVAFLCALLLAQTAIRKRKLAALTTTDLMGIFFAAGIGFSVFNGYSNWQTTIQVIFDRYYTPLLIYFFAKNLVKTQNDADKVLRAVLIFAVYAALYAIYENQTGNILFIKGDVYFSEYKDSGLHVLRGLLERSDHFGALFSMAIPINFYLYLKAETPPKKGLYILTLAIIFIATYLTYKRTAWISILIILFVMQLFYKQFRRIFLVILLMSIVVLGATWSTVSQSAVVTDRINSKVSTMEGRTNGWNSALRLWANNPLFGYGFNNYTKIASARGFQDIALENEHLDVLFGSGLVGAVPYLAWFGFLIWDTIRLFKKSQRKGGSKLTLNKELFILSLTTILAYIINYTTTKANTFSINMVFYLLIGTIVGSQAIHLSDAE